MSTHYRIGDQQIPHFFTLTLVEWVDLFSRQWYKDILLENLCFYTKNQQFVLHAYVVMTNHVHLIASAGPTVKLAEGIRSLKRFTAKKIFDTLIKDDLQEPRRHWLRWIFEAQGKKSSSNEHFKIWIHENHPVELGSAALQEQRLEYIHQNPVRAGICYRAEDYVYPSAAAYAGEESLVPLVMLE